MQMTKIEWVFIGAFMLGLLGFMLHGCSDEATAADSDMYQKCIEVSDSTECNKSFTVYY